MRYSRTRIRALTLTLLSLSVFVIVLVILVDRATKKRSEVFRGICDIDNTTCLVIVVKVERRGLLEFPKFGYVIGGGVLEYEVRIDDRPTLIRTGHDPLALWRDKYGIVLASAGLQGDRYLQRIGDDGTTVATSHKEIEFVPSRWNLVPASEQKRWDQDYLESGLWP